MIVSRIAVEHNITRLFTDPPALQQQVAATATVPDNISTWLGRLRLLYGVPINYLVPDEGMLPPESIRFFYLDTNWINALTDGAFSIGRNLAPAQNTVSMSMDIATTPLIADEASSAALSIRPAALGVAASSLPFHTISGFVLRSALVQAYPGIGVNPYPKDGTPDNTDPTKVVLLPILRMEKLGAASDTLICLVAGDMYRADIHEAPEALHYGIDSFKVDGANVAAQKTMYRFTKSGDPKNPSVTMDMKNPVALTLGTQNCFRTSNDPRTVKMQTLANLIAASQQPALTSIDSSEMGFEMIEGVGMVSFYNKKA